VNLYDVTGTTYPKHLSIPENIDKSALLSSPLNVKAVWTLKGGKKRLGAGGILTHASHEWARLQVNEDIPIPAELRVDIITDKSDSNMFFYGRAVETKRSEKGFSHVIHLIFPPKQTTQAN
jgi:hypothetical protein